MSPILPRLRMLLAGLAASLLVAVVYAAPLPALNIDIKQTSVSGISSGGFMAVQFQVAHSSIIKGAGIIAAGPWNCAQGDVMTATTKCSCTLPTGVCQVSATSTNVPSLVSATRQAAAKGLIDDPVNLTGQKVYTFAGGKDGTVPKPVVVQLGDYYRAFGLPLSSLSAVVKAEAGHTMPTMDYGVACGITGEPYIGQCGVDGARDILAWIYGPLKARQAATPKGKFIQFDQKPYEPSTGWFSFAKTGLDSTGWLYVPEACAKGQACRLHIAFHGCKQGQSYLPLTLVGGGSDLYYGTTFVKHAGYDAWADENKLVILFPQAVSTWNNPNGCWDWWGYTDGHYADKQGIQIRALKSMVDRLSSGAH